MFHAYKPLKLYDYFTEIFKIQRKLMLIALWKLTLVCFLIPSGAVSDPGSWKIGIYGVSDHFKIRPGGRKYTELNYGLSVIREVVGFYPKEFSTALEAGAFRNSYDDLAIWFGINVNYNLYGPLDIGASAYHWETRRSTYNHGLLAVYPTARLRLSEATALKLRISKSAVVASVELTIN